MPPFTQKKSQRERSNKVKRLFIVYATVLVMFFMFTACSFSAEPEDGLKPYVESVEQAKTGMTLWQMVKTGGLIMFILALMSVAALAFIVYNFIMLKPDRLVPRRFVESLIEKLEAKKQKAVKSLCQTEQNIIGSIAMAGLEKKDKGHLVAREAMENSLRKEVGALWQNISYLADIATVSPLIGLLGTVLGMIQAFNVIAFQTAVVKPILLAGGVSKAMVTTAGGLIVAIPAMIFYAYFRAKVQEISNLVESYSTDIIKMVEEL
jgi:biopolymer transport protein ExbB